MHNNILRIVVFLLGVCENVKIKKLNKFNNHNKINVSFGERVNGN